ncbi:MAG: NAD(P)/FAD-dependent oxidoreductase [Planctomycetota bacterium]|nr:MAG: NAD(P)/FAD-dependent oxidoreductase [Planctomycetota bacterium]
MSVNASEPWDLIVIGAGAAGLFAAMTAAERGLRVLLLEKNRRPGVKILMSGGTRCNLTNARGLRSLDRISGPIDPAISPAICQGVRAIQAAFTPEAARFLAPSLKAFDVDSTIGWFESAGLPTKIEENGKIFPFSDRAADVLAVLETANKRAGAEIANHQAVTKIAFHDSTNTFEIQTNTHSHHAQKVVLCTGGKSFPGCGTSGDGYAMAAAFGHTIVETRPALVPIVATADWVRDLKGLTLPDVLVKVVSPDGQMTDQRRESVLFAHFGLTGPAILDISRGLARVGALKGWYLQFDLVPDLKPEQLDQDFITRSRQGRVSVGRLLPESLPNRVKDHVLEVCGISTVAIAAELPKEKRKTLIATLKGLNLPIQGTLGFEKAEVTSGGVALSEVDPKTLQSKLRPGLFLIGEVLDIDGRIGGYNFQAAWSMGRLVGQVV